MPDHVACAALVQCCLVLTQVALVLTHLDGCAERAHALLPVDERLLLLSQPHADVAPQELSQPHAARLALCRDGAFPAHPLHVLLLMWLCQDETFPVLHLPPGGPLLTCLHGLALSLQVSFPVHRPQRSSTAPAKSFKISRQPF